MAEAYRKDNAAEQDFRATARDIDELLDAHGDQMTATSRSALHVAREQLRKDAAQIVRTWD